jgi:hypothetical protein
MRKFGRCRGEALADLESVFIVRARGVVARFAEYVRVVSSRKRDLKGEIRKASRKQSRIIPPA